MRVMKVDLARRHTDRSCELPGGIHAVPPAGHRRLSHPQPLHPGRGHQGVPGLANRWLLPRFCSGFSSRWFLPLFSSRNRQQMDVTSFYLKLNIPPSTYLGEDRSYFPQFLKNTVLVFSYLESKNIYPADKEISMDFGGRIQCCGSGSGIRCLFSPGSGIRNRFFPAPVSRHPYLGSRIPDPGSRIPDPKPIFL
jgi:hypothetical protein